MGKIIKDSFSEEFFVILDQACGGKQNIPLFSSRKKLVPQKSVISII